MLVEGDSVRNLRLATTLERYAERGGDEFATGATARAIVAAQADEGGPVTARDLRDYRVIARRPVAVGFGDSRVLTNPPPSSGGLLIAHTLGVLERLHPPGGPLEAPALIALARALRSAQAQRGPRFERALYRGGARALVLGSGPSRRGCRRLRSSRAGETPAGARNVAHQRDRRGRRGRFHDVLDRLRVGLVRRRHRRAHEQHARRERPRARVARPPAERPHHEHDVADARARRGRRRAARRRKLRLGTDPLGRDPGADPRARGQHVAAGLCRGASHPSRG